MPPRRAAVLSCSCSRRWRAGVSRVDCAVSNVRRMSLPKILRQALRELVLDGPRAPIRGRLIELQNQEVVLEGGRHAIQGKLAHHAAQIGRLDHRGPVAGIDARQALAGGIGRGGTCRGCLGRGRLGRGDSRCATAHAHRRRPIPGPPCGRLCCRESPRQSGRNASMRSNVISNPMRGSGAMLKSRRPFKAI